MFRRTLCLRQAALISQRTIRPCSALDRARRHTSQLVQTRHCTIQTGPVVNKENIDGLEQSTAKSDDLSVWENALDRVRQVQQQSHRRTIRKAIKQYSEYTPPNSPLVEPEQQYLRRSETLRSHSKHINSLRTQSHHAIKRIATGAPEHDLQDTLSLLERHTPAFERVFSLRIGVSKDAAQEFRHRLLNGIDTNVWLIAKRHQSVIRVDEGHRERDLTISLSGSETAVRNSLLDILRTVGQVTAVRVPDTELHAIFARDWAKSQDETTSRVKLLSLHDASSSGKMITILDGETHVPYSPSGNHLDRYLCDIRRPRVWTRWSFEQYVAALIHSKPSPNSEADQRSREAPESHQEIVARRLVKLFESRWARQGTSLSALKLALSYLQDKGPGFRPANERIVAKIEQLYLSADAETYTILLVGASKVNDLASFTSVLKTMVRKQYLPQGKAWIAFLEMIKDKKWQMKVLDAMRRKGLDRIRANRNAMARYRVLIDLEDQVTRPSKTTVGSRHSDTVAETSRPDAFSMSSFMVKHEGEYGKTWLNNVTLNKMLEILGCNGEFQACWYLLDTVKAEGRTSPDIVTLNTMLTHQPDMERTIATLKSILSTYPSIELDRISYSILFSRAWKLYKPFALSVIWRYAVIDGKLHAKRADKLNSLVVGNRLADGSAAQRLRQKWVHILFPERLFREAYEAANAERKNVTYQHFKQNLLKKTHLQVPTMSLAEKLEEAMTAESKSRRVRKEQQGDLLPEQIESFYVDIPLKYCEEKAVQQEVVSNPSSRQLNYEENEDDSDRPQRIPRRLDDARQVSDPSSLEVSRRGGINTWPWLDTQHSIKRRNMAVKNWGTAQG